MPGYATELHPARSGSRPRRNQGRIPSFVGSWWLLLTAAGWSGEPQPKPKPPAEPAAEAAAPAKAAPVRRSVDSAGAAADASRDATSAFQALLDQAGREGGGIVEVPAGRYRIDGNLSIPAGVTLQGSYRAAPTPHRNAAGEPTGSVLLARAGRGSAEGEPFVRLAGSNAVFAGFVVSYPEWKQSDVPPLPYPPTIESHDTENVAILDCLLLNPYEAIRLVRAHRHLVRNITGYPIRRGIFVDECYDIGHIENIHFWPFGVAYDPLDPYCLWVNTQGVAFELARTDWHYVSNTFCFGYGVGYLFSRSRTGSTNGNFLGLGADSCQRAVVVEEAQAPGLLITNGEFVGRWSSRDSVCVEVGESVSGKVSLVNCAFWGPIDRCVWVRGPAAQFTASACNFVHWDVAGSGAPAIRLDAGKAIIQGSSFAQEGLDIEVGAEVVSAIIVGNQGAAGLRVENRAGRRTLLFANEEDPIEWTAEARRSWRIEVGAEGDGRYLRQWHGREALPTAEGTRTMRWSTDSSWIIVPAPEGEASTLTLELSVPAASVGPEAGLYLAGRRVAELSAESPTLSVELPAGGAEMRLELRAVGWVPSKTNPGSKDDRRLGVSVSAIGLRAKDAGPRVFDGNTGKWKSEGAR